MGARFPPRFPGLRAAPASGVALLVAAAFVACGGEDDGRPPPPSVAGAGGGSSDACEAALAYELMSIVDFEGPPAVSAPGTGYPALQGTALSCNRALLGSVSGGAGGQAGQGGDAGSAGAGGEASTGGVPVCGFNFNYDQTVLAGSGDCERDTVAMGKFRCNLATESPWVGLEVPGGRCGAPTHAYHLEATNLGVCFSDDYGRRGWGSNFLLAFKSDEAGPNPQGVEIDASAWDGIAFWARLGDGLSNSAINVLVGDAETSGGDYAEPAPNGWTRCFTADSTSDTVKCDPFGVAVTLTKDWVFYVIPWAELKQKGYGQVAPRGEIDPSRIYRFQISTSTGDWDFYLDDLSFYRNRP